MYTCNANRDMGKKKNPTRGSFSEEVNENVINVFQPRI